MPDHEQIYQTEAARYDRLISRQPDLLQVVEAILPITGLDIIDLGAGTGRLTCVLAEKVGSILALDASEVMLKVAAEKLQLAGLYNWRTQAADHRAIPAENASADLIVSGWSICYIASSNLKDWQHNLGQVMEEIQRVIRPGGTAIIIETMGTGYETPHPPDFLLAYYSMLEHDFGFAYRWIRTDYAFVDHAEAEQLTRFFFGDELADQVVFNGIVALPECAGVWWRKF
jgi:ubiquinone/menaquinone biosynthesis C-methylase UbiE